MKSGPTSTAPKLYLMAPMQCYGSVGYLEAIKYPWDTLIGSPVTVVPADGLYKSNQDWLTKWNRQKIWRDFAYGAFVDDGGWIGRGVALEVNTLKKAGVPVWWHNDGEPTQDWELSSPTTNWQRYMRVGAPETRPW